ncbi:MAG: ATP-binding protein [Sporolactobacillus sp.]
MILRSVVTKLWATIIALVTLVLLFLTFLLLQFFENSNLQQTEVQLEKIGQKAVQLIQGEDHRTALNSVSDITDVYHAGSSVFIGSQYQQKGGKGIPRLSSQFFKNDPQLKEALNGTHRVEKHGVFQLASRSGRQTQLMVVGIPMRLSDGRHGTVYVYQSLQIAQNAMDRSKKLIYISTGIAIILTTFFAFFLSTRIGLPLRKMRSAALQVARGNFDMNVPVITTDEVGELAVAFNKMRIELKANVTASEQEKEQLAGIIDNMADGVLLLGEKGELMASNPPANHFLKASNFENHENRENWKMTPEIITEWLIGEDLQKKQIVHELSVQGHFWVIILTPLRDKQKLRGAVAVLRDMTEERQLDQMKRGFVANVSHELRTPIAMIQGYSEAIIDDIAETEQDKKEMAKIVLDESKRLGRLVSELLDLAKLEAGHFQLNKRSTLLTAFFDHAVGKFQNLAQREGIDLSLQCDLPENEKFVMDPDRIEQVLTNLIDNAIRHTSKGCSVAVHIRMLPDALRVRVRDTGTGIAKEDLPFVFERFYKADKSRKRGKAGTGLGLSIAKHIIDAHGGDITVHSKKGEGTMFEFFLPKIVEKDWDNPGGTS